MLRTTTLTKTVEITQLGDEAYLAYQYQLEDTRPEPTAEGGPVFDLIPPF